MKNNYVFKEKEDGTLVFVGDFESLYLNESDPWHQSASSDNEISKYYQYSRNRLNTQLKIINPNSIVEIGCGLGHTTDIIQKSMTSSEVFGIDISNAAILKAQKLYPNLHFRCADITLSNFSFYKKSEVVILSQLLWYILKSLPTVFDNCFSLLSENGSLIITQAFLRSQKYGVEICNGFEGLINYINENAANKFKIEFSNLDDSEQFIHNDGLIVLKRK